MLKENLNNLLSKPWDTMPLELTQNIASQLSGLSEEIKEMVVVVYSISYRAWGPQNKILSATGLTPKKYENPCPRSQEKKNF